MVSDYNRKESLIAKRHKEIGEFEKSLFPSWPKGIMLELSSVCNHSCEFCAYIKTNRAKTQANIRLMERIVQEAYDLGTREIGLHSGTEPFTSPHLEHFISFSKEIGYSYVYCSTNGSIATPTRLKTCADNGLDSIKFSVNAGSRKTYRKVHGRDHFDRVTRNIKYLNNYRRERKLSIYLSISFVEYEGNRGEFELVHQMFSDYVDEIVKVQAVNQSGQVQGLPSFSETTIRNDLINYPYQKAPCPLPFNRIHISSEGYLRACCNDYQNYLALEELHEISLEDAFYSSKFAKLRQLHLDDNLEGLICQGCLYGQNSKPVKPFNSNLSTNPLEDFFSNPLPD